MQHGDEHDAFHRELEAATFQKPAQNVGHAELLPKFLEHQRRAKMDGAAGRDLIGLQRVEHRDMITQASQRFEQLVELACFLEHIESPERSDDSLSDLSVIDLCAANEPRAPSGSPDLASKMLAAGFICRATMNNNKLKLITRKSYGFRTQQAYEIAPYHNLGALPEREFTHTFL